MKKVELKRIAELLWKTTPPDEKTPFAHQGTVSEHGSISKNLEPDDKKIPEKEISEKDGDKLEGPMSIPRKLCFMLSFNICVLYFLMLGWVIPCRNLNCGAGYEDVLERNLTSIWRLTNLETFNVEGFPSLAMLGYADGETKNLSAIKADDGTFEWNRELTFTPRSIQCKFGIIFDANGDNISDCLLTGFNDVYAFNASNGFVFWQQNLPSEEGNIVSQFHPTSKHNNSTYLIGTRGDEMIVLDARNGTKVSEMPLPCFSPFVIKIIPNVVSPNYTFWSIVCDYGDKIEAWGFEEHDLLDGGYSKGSDNAADEFALLFRRESDFGGSIDLGCDVTPIPGGLLLLSWSDRVAMVTPNATAWERRFTFPLTVACIEVGKFTDSKELQITAAVHNGTNSIVYILDAINGTTVKSVLLKDRDVLTLEKIAGDIDSLVVKSAVLNYTTYPISNLSDPIPMEKTNFVLVQFRDNALQVKDIVTTTTVLDSAVNSRTSGEVDLLILTMKNADTFFHKYIIHRSSKEDGVFCAERANHKTHFSSEM